MAARLEKYFFFLTSMLIMLKVFFSEHPKNIFFGTSGYRKKKNNGTSRDIHIKLDTQMTLAVINERKVSSSLLLKVAEKYLVIAYQSYNAKVHKISWA